MKKILTKDWLTLTCIIGIISGICGTVWFIANFPYVFGVMAITGLLIASQANRLSRPITIPVLWKRSMVKQLPEASAAAA